MNGTAAVEEILATNFGVLDAGAHRPLRSTIWRLHTKGTLVRVFPGIYVRSGTEHLTLIWLAAVCAWHPGIVLTGATAVALLTGNLPRHVMELGPVTWHRPIRTRSEGRVRVRRRAVSPDDVVSVGGIRVHTAAAAAVDAADLDDGRTIDEVLRICGTDPAELKPHLARHWHTPGNATRRRVVAASMTRPYSYGERQLQRLLIDAGITDWVANSPLRLGGRTVRPDILFPYAHLVIEFDGRRFHGPDVFEADRERQNLFVRHRYLVLRITWDMVHNNPEYVIATVRATLRTLAAA